MVDTKKLASMLADAEENIEEAFENADTAYDYASEANEYANSCDSDLDTAEDYIASARDEAQRAYESADSAMDYANDAKRRCDDTLALVKACMEELTSEQLLNDFLYRALAQVWKAFNSLPDEVMGEIDKIAVAELREAEEENKPEVQIDEEEAPLIRIEAISDGEGNQE